jgi:outer membrane protein, heavy metal efflux system
MRPRRHPPIARPSAAERSPRAVLLVLAALCAGASGVPAGAPADAPEATPAWAGAPLTLAESERLAIAASPVLAGAAARVRQAEGLRHQADLYPDPELSLDTSWFTGGLDPRETILGFRQPVPFHGKRGLEKSEAEERVAAARAQAERDRLDLLLGVRESWYRIGYIGRILEAARSSVETTREAKAAVDQRVAAGDAAPSEALRASVEVSRAETEVRRVEGELDSESAVFDLLLGLPPSSRVTVAGLLDTEPPADDLASILERASQADPEIRAREHLALAAGFAAERARIEARPDIAIGPSVGVDQGDSLVGVGFSLRLPLWNRARGLAAAAEAGRDAAGAETGAARLAVESAVVESFRRYRSAAGLRRLYEDGLLAQADEAVTLATRAYEGGQTGILDLLDARRTALAIKVDYYRACIEAAVAAARLRRAAAEEGEPAP